jgi:1-acyl-sn-glycerol-3-phosphate acyltransferase
MSSKKRESLGALLWSVIVVEPLIVLATLIFGIVSVIVTLFDGTGDAAIEVARVWARTLLWISGVQVTVEGLEKLDHRHSYVLCSNHLSYMDTPVVLSHIHVRFRFLAKRGLFQIPLLGTHLSQAGHIPVPREDPRAAIKTMTRAAETIRARGISMLVFPEGGRSRDGELRAFKEGAAYIAIKAGVPLVPIALIGTREIMPMGSAVIRRGPVRVVVSDPIPTEGLTLRDRDVLTAEARERIVRILEA